MPQICAEIVLNVSKEEAIREIATVDFMRKLDPNFGQSTEILFQNERLICSLSKVERVGEVAIERIIIPENFMIITQRRPPLAPFKYQISFQMFYDHAEGALLKWIDEFELDDDNKVKEEMILGVIKKNDITNLQKTQSYFMNRKP